MRRANVCAGPRRLRTTAGWIGLLVVALLSACALPERPPAPRLYDFGPVTAAVPDAAPGARAALGLRVQASPALDGQALLYRLAYADAQQLHAYSQARWSMPPAELVQQRLRVGLGRQYALLPDGESAPRLLYVELEEFCQLFDTPADSRGVLRLRASVLQGSAGGDQLLAQRTWLVQRPAGSADAPGGVRALTAATDAAVEELAQWLQQLR